MKQLIANVSLITMIRLFGLTFIGIANAKANEIETLKSNLLAHAPKLVIESIHKSPVNALYEVQLATGETIYAFANGQYFLAGNLFKAEKGGSYLNVTKANKTQRRQSIIENLSTNTAISYPAMGTEKAQISVFTDVDCSFCRRFHGEVTVLNELGITVNYYAYPRMGLNSATYKTMNAIWCANDKQSALTQAKLNKEIDANTCNGSIDSHYKLAKSIGVRVTPSIVLANGELVEGYQQAKILAGKVFSIQ
ncbi:DsbC family protein [Litorilituus lipolyticus]|uniref:Thiol:disulfide interchange protein n=1 Tax=Litorilituus lipolyticus TaxID=2491017 RepID=A0A502KSW6_9GAMM|nr:DsbC family protein [Litorilituus lipolyticus]TPH14606.1 DsbC family protein [Litorilituus lipolyticus]